MAFDSPNVCHACKLRKKACDKTLPTCGFCCARKLSCRYDVERPDRTRRVYNPGKHFVPLPMTPSTDALPHAAHAMVGSAAYGSEVNSSDECYQSTPRVSVAEQAQEILGSLDVSADRLRYDYFTRCNEWLPVISLSSFDSLEPDQSRNTPEADVSTLLLCMHLASSVAESRDRENKTTSCRSGRSLYGTIKALISQLGAQICASLPLVQATLLLAECEYVCILPKNAYVTLASCAAMAKLLDMQNGATDVASSKSVNDPSPDKSERVNVSWALAMIERYAYDPCSGKPTR